VCVYRCVCVFVKFLHRHRAPRTDQGLIMITLYSLTNLLKQTPSRLLSVASSHQLMHEDYATYSHVNSFLLITSLLNSQQKFQGCVIQSFHNKYLNVSLSLNNRCGST